MYTWRWNFKSIFHNLPWCNFHHKYICLFFILESQFPTIWDQPAVQLILKVFYERSFCKKKVARKEWRFYSSPRNAMGRCNMAIDMCQKMEFNNSTECDALLAPYLFSRFLVRSTNQACSSCFYFRIAWKSRERPCLLQNHSFSFLQGLRSLNN